MVMVSQSDMSCMVSPELFQKFVIRELDLLGERYGLIWYHLDGADAIRHLPALLSRPYIRAIQFVPGAGKPPNGPEYINLYQEVLAAKRCLDIEVPLDQVEYLVRRLRPEGVLLRTWTDTPEDADELLDKVKKWRGSHSGRG
jgi:hypothetical protein